MCTLDVHGLDGEVFRTRGKRKTAEVIRDSTRCTVTLRSNGVKLVTQAEKIATRATNRADRAAFGSICMPYVRTRVLSRASHTGDDAHRR